MKRLLRVAVVNDFELIVRGLATMLDPFHDRVLVVESDVHSNPESWVDIALFDTYGHRHGGVDRVRSLAAEPKVGAVVVYAWAFLRGNSMPYSGLARRAACSRNRLPRRRSSRCCSRSMAVSSW